MSKTDGFLRGHARYFVAIVAVVCGLYFSIVNSDSGWLMPSPQSLFADADLPEGQYDLQALNILNRALLQVGENYVDQSRIDPNQMLVYALNAIQEEIPQVVAHFDRPLNEQPTSVNLLVGRETQRFSVQNISSLWEMSFRLREIFRFVQTNLEADENVNLRDVEYAAINGILSTLDPHSVLLNPEIYADMQANNRGSFGGIGIVISIREGHLTIISPIDGTPAHRAGLRARDLIVKIGEESTINMAIEEAVSRLRGEPGTAVSIEVMRDGWTVPHEFTIVREIINIQSVKYHILGDGIGHIQISNFQGNTHDDLLAALAAFRSEMGELRGLILDLRANPGGLLEQAIKVADTFLDQGTIVTTVGAGQRIREERKATENGTEPLYPIVVLVSSGSASASEIVAGALQNLGRGVVAGDRTFGKGTVQVLYPFQDGSALKLTIAQYLTPGDISIQTVGIIPDIPIIPMTVSETSVDLYPSERTIREGDLETHLDSILEILSPDGTIGMSAAAVRYYREPEPPFDPSVIEDPDDFEVDFEIDFAHRLLLAAGSTWQREAMLTLTESVRQTIAEEQIEMVTARLAERGVDWSAGEPSDQLDLDIRISSNWPANTVPAGETLEITLTATNLGSEALHRLWAVSKSSHRLFDDHEFPLGRLGPGETRSWTNPLEIRVEELTRLDRMEFNFRTGQTVHDVTVSEHYTIQGKPRPHFGFTYQILDDEQGNGDGLLQLGEGVTFRFTVTNMGEGDARSTLVYLKNEVETAVLLEHGRETWEDGLAAGTSRSADFQFQIRYAPEDGMIRFRAAVYDTVFREFTSEDLVLPLRPEGELFRPASGAVSVRRDGALIHTGADESTPILAVVDAGAVFEKLGTLGDWVRIGWGSLGFGWVPSSALREVDSATSPSQPMQQVALQPPMITLQPYNLWTDLSTFPLVGHIQDNEQVADYFIWVAQEGESNQRVKVNYTRVEARNTDFRQDIPLFPGSNRIIIQARDNNRMTHSSTHFIYRRSSEEALSNAQ